MRQQIFSNLLVKLSLLISTDVYLKNQIVITCITHKNGLYAIFLAQLQQFIKIQGLLTCIDIYSLVIEVTDLTVTPKYLVNL
ncbi:hypothetical protein F8Q89_14460 [Prevotella copri]|nr:hypothetical protein [Segatella copri]